MQEDLCCIKLITVNSRKAVLPKINDNKCRKRCGTKLITIKTKTVLHKMNSCKQETLCKYNMHYILYLFYMKKMLDLKVQISV